MIGSDLGNYRITGQIGEGGMGAVYRGEHKLIGRPAAIKVLLPHFCHNQSIVDRFFNEAKAATAIAHPGIVEIYDFGYDERGGGAYIVMELLQGESLEARLQRRHTLGTTESIDMLLQISSALGAAHEAGIVHRDLKPDNIFLVPDPVSGGERTKILDFGIAKLTAGDGGLAKTATGAVMGTPAFMAPEQCKGSGQVDRRADLYSLGCILYRVLCGRPPFVGEGAGEILAAHIHVEPARPCTLAPGMPPALEALLLRLLAKDPAARHASAADLARDLVAVRPTISGTTAPVLAAPSAGPPQPTTLGAAAASYTSPGETGSRPRRTAIAAGAVALLAGAVFALTRGGATAPAIPAVVQVSAPAAAPIEPAPIEPAPIEIVIGSEPPGAQVFLMPDRVHVGETPYVRRGFPAQGKLVFYLAKNGHVGQELSVDAAHSSRPVVRLVPEARRARRPERPSRAEPLVEPAKPPVEPTKSPASAPPRPPPPKKDPSDRTVDPFGN